MNPRDSSPGVVCALPTTKSPAESTMNVSVIVPPASIASTRGSRPFVEDDGGVTISGSYRQRPDLLAANGAVGLPQAGAGGDFLRAHVPLFDVSLEEDHSVVPMELADHRLQGLDRVPATALGGQHRVRDLRGALRHGGLGPADRATVLPRAHHPVEPRLTAVRRPSHLPALEARTELVEVAGSQPDAQVRLLQQPKQLLSVRG